MNSERPAHAGTSRLAISGYVSENWYFCWSPSNPELGAEGSWQQWVELAREILRENDRLQRRAGSSYCEIEERRHFISR